MRDVLLTRAVLTKAKQNGFFFFGLAVGLWVALVAVPVEDPPASPCAAPLSAPAAIVDEYEPAHTVRPPSAAAPSRTVTRPRYYTTELGVRAPLMTAVLTTETALVGMGAALNATLRALHPAVRLLVAAAGRASPPRPYVVGFTDARLTLTPFHALKYLADNHLDDYHYFFLVSDTTYVNAKRLQELVSRLSVSHPVYMGVGMDPSSGSGEYCTLEGGVLMSRGVLQAVHTELDWCVRNAYSQQHGENVGRCVLHAAKVGCMSSLQGETYSSLQLSSLPAFTPAIARAVTVYPVTDSILLHQLHAYTCRVHLEAVRNESLALVEALPALTRKHPPHYRNVTWPPGLRTDTGLSAPAPPSRWDHLRWTLFNATHAYLPSDHSALGPLGGAVREAIHLVISEAIAWTRTHWGWSEAALVEGAWQWEPATALRYLLQLRGSQDGHAQSVRQVSVARALGAARLVAAPYVTESGRVRIVLPVHAARARSAGPFVRRHIERKLDNAALTVVVLESAGACSDAGCQSDLASLRALVTSAGQQYVSAPLEGAVCRAALLAAARRAPAHSLLLLLTHQDDYTNEMLNRVRMNTIAGYQWFLLVPFARYSLYSHPLFVDAKGNKPSQRTGHFNARIQALAVYSADLSAAVAECGSDVSLTAPELVHCSGLRVLRAPEPGLLRGPHGPACVATDTEAEFQSCLQSAARDLHSLQLGAPNDLAKLLLQTNA